ncbi:MAG: MurR/RpiR family transcriptional regulator [Erysipelothrix sp.]|nr:MurR/RpiR family transcriptional regulator [Erysipelothrix sp.]
MISVYRIREAIETATATERQIGEFVLENRDFVIESSVQELAKAIGVSPAAIVRFSKKVGFKGFSNMKMLLAQDKSPQKTIVFDAIIQESDSLDTLMDKARLSNLNTTDLTYKLLDRETYNETVNRLIGARRIYLTGIGASHLVATDMFQKLVRIDQNVICVEEYNLFLSSLANATSEDVLLGFSYSGQTPEVLYAFELAKEKGMYTSAVTQIGNNALSKIANSTFTIPSEETDLRLGSISSRYAMLHVVDLLYYGIVRDDFDNNRKRLENTREVIKKFKF